MTMNDLIEGLDILNSYNDPDGSVSAHRDGIYLSGPPPERMVPIDARFLKGLGFNYSTTYECWEVKT